jgi:hypothetical protein
VAQVMCAAPESGHFEKLLRGSGVPLCRARVNPARRDESGSSTAGAAYRWGAGGPADPRPVRA